MVYNEQMTELLIQRINILENTLKEKDNIRLALAKLPQIAYAIRGIMDITTDPGRIFISYLLVEQFSHVQTVYDGRTEKWYELNAENVQEFKNTFLEFISNLKEHLPHNDEQQIIEDIKMFFVEFHKLARTTTLDTRE